ncbi:hypothetical protein Tco_0371584 [Tanacetum coccineum]
MSAITDVKCVLSQKAFDAFCEKFHIPEEVHPVLPNRGDTMHERPAEKIRHFRINISQLSVIGAAKVDDFACPARFSWHTAKNVTMDPAPAAADFNAQDYATLVAHPSPFRKIPEEFLCLVGLSRHYTLDEETYPSFLDKDGEDMDIFAFIYTPDPTKVKIVMRERREDEPQLLDTIVGRTVSLLPVAPDCAEGELESSVDKLFDEGSSGNQAEQGDFAGGGGGQGVNIQLVIEVADAAAEDVVPAQPRRQKKRKTIVADVGGPSHPPKKLKEDHGTPSGASVGGKSSEVLIGFLQVYIPQWNVTNGSRLNDGGIFCEMVDEFAPPKFFASVRGMEHDQLFTEFNVGAARQMSLSAEVRMRAEYNIRENKRLKSVVEEKDELLKTRDEEIENLKAHMLLKEAEAADVIDQVHELQVSSSRLKEKLSNYENLTKRLEEFQDAQLKLVNDKFDKLYANFVEIALYLEEKFYPHLLTTISSRRWLLTYGMELVNAKCLNSPEYLFALKASIGKAIEKGMQDGLSAGITHGKEGKVLTDVAAYNPSTEVDYVSALQQLQNVNFSLLAELKTNKDASVKILMNILRLEETLAERLGLNKTVIGASALSLALGVSDALVRKIRENITSHKYVLQDVFVHLAEPFSAAVVTGTEGTSDVVPATAGTTAALSITIASVSTVTPISVDDYEVTGTDDQAATNENVADGNVNPFPNVDDAELNIPQ